MCVCLFHAHTKPWLMNEKKRSTSHLQAKDYPTGCQDMADALFQVTLVYILCVSVSYAVMLAGSCGYLDDPSSRFTMIAQGLVPIVGLINLGFVMNYIIQGWTNEDDGSGIDKFHEFCTQDDLGDWAYGMMMFFTVLLCIVGAFLGLAICCAVNVLICGGALKFPYGG